MAKVACALCGKEVHRVATHVRVHALTTSEYALRFPSAPLHSDEYAQKQARIAAEAWKRDDVQKRYEDGIKKRRSYKGENNPFHGKKHTVEFCERQSENRVRVSRMKESVQWWYDFRRGKTVEEVYGESKGAEIRAKIAVHSRGSRNPAFGKVYDNGNGRGIGGWYKGKMFRSTYEYAFYRHLEDMGVAIDSVCYEAVSISYLLGGTPRTYFPDFLVGADRLYEVKSTWGLNRNRQMNEAKFAAARDFCEQRGWAFQVLTEQDFPLYPASVIRMDPDVRLRKEA